MYVLIFGTLLDVQILGLVFKRMLECYVFLATFDLLCDSAWQQKPILCRFPVIIMVGCRLAARPLLCTVNT